MYLKLILSLIILINLNFANAEESEFSLGVAVCLSGTCSEWGTSALRGVQLASEEINSNGGLIQ